jgi:NADH-quinone oxidoreductase subunit L
MKLNPIDFGQLLAAAPDHYNPLGWIILLPLIGAIINGFWGRRIGRQGVYITAISAVGASFLLALVSFAALLRAGNHAAAAALAEGQHHHAVTTLSFRAWDWFIAPLGPTAVEMIPVRYVVDPLSGVMLLVVTGVGTLIHVYSAGYMSHDPGYARFFAYLNLFIFAMLNLILGDSLVTMFLGWEGVGLASYLLIGFWYTNNDYATAGRKAFIVNRIGDAGLILGMTILAWKGGSYQFETLRAHLTDDTFINALHERTGLGRFLVDAVPMLGSIEWIGRFVTSIDFSWGGAACLLLFVGCCGKSAQFPLYVWLPDAMAGPTPVSALIHAATMVTAGIYLLCRLSFLFTHFSTVLSIIALVGAFTALFAATIAVTQVELKKVLAYSTVSQLGFMFMGCGVGAFSAGFFHVFTHAFFKACLFLGAGAVMHACGDRQDIRKLGGLKNYLPKITWAMTAATAAIIGTPLTSGFFSKDEILFRALSNPFAPTVGKIVFAMGLAAATLTAFYMCRMMLIAFDGDGPRYHDPDQAAVAHDSHGHAVTAHADDGHGHGDANALPSEHGTDMMLMVVPVIILAVLALLVGPLGLPQMFMHREGFLATFLEPAVADVLQTRSPEIVHHVHSYEPYSMAAGVLSWLLGSGLAFWVYKIRHGEPAAQVVAAFPRLYRLVFDKWRIDELYDVTILRLTRGAAIFAAGFDRYVIDGLVNLVGTLAMGFGRVIKPIQTGAIQVYGAFVGVGTLALVLWATMLPAVSIAYRPAAGAAPATFEASGGPGYTYRWAFYDPDPRPEANLLDQRCPVARAEEALVRAEAPTTATQHNEAVTAPRCAAVLATNAFGRTVLARTLVLPQGADQPAVNPR